MARDARHFRVVESADADLVVGSEKAERRAQAGKVFRSRCTDAQQADGNDQKRQSRHDILQILCGAMTCRETGIEIKRLAPHIGFMSSLPLERDLFDEPALPGLAQAEAIVTPAEERDLIA